jgi:hypothetical protein
MADAYRFPDEQEPKAEKDEIQITFEGEEEVEIETIDDTPINDRGRPALDRVVEDPTDQELESYSDKVRNRIKALTHARHDERRGKEATQREKQELERFSQQLLKENNQLKQFVNTGTQQYATQAKSSAEREVEIARTKYKEATESFDSEAIISAQEKFYDARRNLERAQEYRPTSLQPQEYEVQTSQQAPEAAQPDEKTLRWQAQNQWFGATGFEDVTSYALGLHQKLVNTGIDPRSDDYFSSINTNMKSKFPEVFGGNQEKAKSVETPKRPSNVVAPASRSTGVRKIQLTVTQQQLARKFGLTPKQYAEQVAKLES